MAESRRFTHNSFRVVIDIAFLVLGSFLFLGILNIPTLDFWTSWLLAIAGVMIATLPYPTSRWAGLGIALVGVYSIIRIADVITLPVLQYGIALIFILIGTVNLVRGAHEKDAQATKTPKISV